MGTTNIHTLPLLCTIKALTLTNEQRGKPLWMIAALHFSPPRKTWLKLMDPLGIINLPLRPTRISHHNGVQGLVFTNTLDCHPKNLRVGYIMARFRHFPPRSCILMMLASFLIII